MIHLILVVAKIIIKAVIPSIFKSIATSCMFYIATSCIHLLTNFHVCTISDSTERRSKVNIPRDCVFIHVERVGIVDVTKALENVIAIWQQSTMHCDMMF